MSFVAKTLEEFLLQRLELRPFEGASRLPSWKQFQEQTLDEVVVETFENLGSIVDQPPVHFPSFFFENEFFILLFDDERHFNKYRSVTLRSELYDKVETGFDLEKYRRYCRQKGLECMKKGRMPGQWTNAAAEKCFGPAGDPGELGRKGAPGWKLRAFQDLLVDSIPLFHKDLKVIRFSVWDEIFIHRQLKPLHKVIMEQEEGWDENVEQYLRKRLPMEEKSPEVDSNAEKGPVE